MITYSHVCVLCVCIMCVLCVCIMCVLCVCVLCVCVCVVCVHTHAGSKHSHWPCSVQTGQVRGTPILSLSSPSQGPPQSTSEMLYRHQVPKDQSFLHRKFAHTCTIHSCNYTNSSPHTHTHTHTHTQTHTHTHTHTHLQYFTRQGMLSKLQHRQLLVNNR